jgi:hypothetical protein
LLIRQNYLNNNIDYQLKQLKEGNTSEKIKAISFLSDKKVISIIPTLIDNIDNQDRAYWSNDPKGGLISVSCIVSIEMENLTGNNFGRICYYDDKSDDPGVVKKKWQDWYKNEYPEWLKNHQNDNEYGPY